VGVRETAPDLLEDWRRYEKALLTKLANRDRELLELHQDYLALEVRCNALHAYARRYWEQQDIEIANRRLVREIDI
jgi:hypothetical protein